jgi:hypothetical protein
MKAERAKRGRNDHSQLPTDFSFISFVDFYALVSEIL